MATNSYVQGALVTVSAVFVNSAGTPIDPAIVKLNYNVDSNLETSLLYPTGGIIRDGVGTYHYTIDTTPLSGQYNYRWWSQGTGQASNKYHFIVETSALQTG